MDDYVFKIYLRFLDCVAELLSKEISPVSDRTLVIVNKVKSLFDKYPEFGLLRKSFEKFLNEKSLNNLSINTPIIVLYKKDAYNLLEKYNNKHGINIFLNNLKKHDFSDVDRYILSILFVVDMILFNNHLKDDKCIQFLIPKAVYDLIYE